MIVRALGWSSGEADQLVGSEIVERGVRGECTKFKYSEGGPGEDRLMAYIKGATGVERFIGNRVWLGTLVGLARRLDSTDVVVPGNPVSRWAYIILRVPEKPHFDAPVGSLAAIQVSRQDVPAGATVPDGATLWYFTGSLIANQKCG